MKLTRLGASTALMTALVFAPTAMAPVAQASTPPIVTVKVGGMPTGIAMGANGNAYVANQTNNNVNVIDPVAGVLVLNIPVGPKPQPPTSSVDGSKVYVSSQGDNTVRVISTSSNTVVATIAVGDGPGKPAVSSTRAYVSNVNSNDVSVIDLATNTVIATIPVGKNPTTGVFGEGNQYQVSSSFYVSNTTQGTVSVIDTSTNTVTNTIVVGGQISATAQSGTMNSCSGVFASVTNSGQLGILSQSSAAQSFVAVGEIPGTPTTNIDGCRVYVANAGSKSVSVVSLDASPAKVIATIPVGSKPGDPVTDSSKANLYVPNFGAATVTAISTSTNAVRATYQVGNSPMGVTITKNGSLLLVSNSADGSVSVVKTASSAYPKPPTKVAVNTSTPKQGKISWKKSTTSGVTGYLVTALPGGKTCSTTGTTCTINGLTGGNKYTFAVQSKSKYGAGSPANSAKATIKK